MSLGQNNAAQDLDLTQVFYVPSTAQQGLALKEGQIVVYDSAAALTATDTLTNGVVTLGSRKALIGRQVTDPASTLVGGFAGVVDSSSAGVVPANGGTMITIIRPRKGDVCQMLTKANSTKNATILVVDSAGPTINLIAGASTVGTPTVGVLYDQVAVALQTLDTSTTAGLTWCRFF